MKGFCPSFVSRRGRRPRRGKARAGGGRLRGAARTRSSRASTDPYGILVTGVGGTGIITVGALLGMAAHLEGKGVSVLDMTGLAQKSGAVMTPRAHRRAPEDLHATRIAAGEANAVIGCDLLVAAEPDAHRRCSAAARGR